MADAHVEYTLLHQSIADLELVSKEFAQAVLDNTRTTDVLALDNPDLCERLARSLGLPFSDIDRQAMSSDELDRQLATMAACWAFFDSVRSCVSAEMQKGPRGGGRDRSRDRGGGRGREGRGPGGRGGRDRDRGRRH